MFLSPQSEDITPSEISNINTAWRHLHLGSYKTELGGVVVTGGWGKQGDIGQMYKRSVTKLTSSWDLMYKMAIVANNTVSCP